MLTDHLTSRAIWDEPPALMLITPVAGMGCSLVPIDIPAEHWGHPATVMRTLVERLKAPDTAAWLTAGGPPVWGAALRYKGWVAETSPEETQQRAARNALGLPVPEPRDMPDSAEARLMHPHDVTGRAYALRQHRGSAQAEPIPGETGGRIPAALRGLVTVLHTPGL